MSDLTSGPGRNGKRQRGGPVIALPTHPADAARQLAEQCEPAFLHELIRQLQVLVADRHAKPEPTPGAHPGAHPGAGAGGD